MALQFGTGGLRGIMGEGENQMNGHAVAKATRGFARMLRMQDEKRAKESGVVIAFDTRHRSRDFARVAAAALIEEGIPAWCFEEPVPTPVLSFAVRHLKAAGGIVITASHNPKAYNGYKAYNAQGCQLVPHEADQVSIQMDMASDALPEDAKPRLVPVTVRDAYLQAVMAESLFTQSEAKKTLEVVYTPLHGTGDAFVRDALRMDGFENVMVVAAQQTPDGEFPTVKSPNPEDRQALAMAVEMARVSGADIVIGTDPDCDRVGAAVKHDGECCQISGNQMGALLMDFILTQSGALPKNGAVVKTIVTNDLGAALARKAGLTVFETLTGFKYIGEKIGQFETSGAYRYVFGYEESYGYLKGTYARDKDAVVASMLICEMAAYHKEAGRTLVDALKNIYTIHGVYLDALLTIDIDDMEKTRAVMQALRNVQENAYFAKATMLDYLAGIGDLPKEDVLKLIWPDESWIAVRPSGTEPKLKVYYAAKGKTEAEAEAKLLAQQANLHKIIEDAM